MLVGDENVFFTKQAFGLLNLIDSIYRCGTVPVFHRTFPDVSVKPRRFDLCDVFRLKLTQGQCQGLADEL